MPLSPLVPVSVFGADTGTLYDLGPKPSRTTFGSIREVLAEHMGTGTNDLLLLARQRGSESPSVHPGDEETLKDVLPSLGEAGCDDPDADKIYCYNKRVWESPPAAPVKVPFAKPLSKAKLIECGIGFDEDAPPERYVEGTDLASDAVAANDDDDDISVGGEPAPHAGSDPGGRPILGALIESEKRLFSLASRCDAAHAEARARDHWVHKLTVEVEIMSECLCAAESRFAADAQALGKTAERAWERHGRRMEKQSRLLATLGEDLERLGRVPIAPEIAETIATRFSGQVPTPSAANAATAGTTTSGAGTTTTTAASGSGEGGAGGAGGGGGNRGIVESSQVRGSVFVPGTLADLTDMRRLNKFIEEIKQQRDQLHAKVAETVEAARSAVTECTELAATGLAADVMSRLGGDSTGHGAIDACLSSLPPGCGCGPLSDAVIDTALASAEDAVSRVAGVASSARRECEHVASLVARLLSGTDVTPADSSGLRSVDAATDEISAAIEEIVIGAVAKDSSNKSAGNDEERLPALVELEGLASAVAKVHHAFKCAMFARMGAVSRASARVRSTRKMLNLRRGLEDRLARDFEQVESVSLMPGSYAALEAEIRRRKKFASDFAGFYAKIAKKMAGHRDKECDTRDRFDRDHGDHLPGPLQMLMAERPPPYEMAMRRFDHLLPNLRGAGSDPGNEFGPGVGGGNDGELRERSVSEPFSQASPHAMRTAAAAAAAVAAGVSSSVLGGSNQTIANQNVPNLNINQSLNFGSAGAASPLDTSLVGSGINQQFQGGALTPRFNGAGSNLLAASAFTLRSGIGAPGASMTGLMSELERVRAELREARSELESLRSASNSSAIDSTVDNDKKKTTDAQVEAEAAPVVVDEAAVAKAVAEALAETEARHETDRVALGEQVRLAREALATALGDRDAALEEAEALAAGRAAVQEELASVAEHNRHIARVLRGVQDALGQCQQYHQPLSEDNNNATTATLSSAVGGSSTSSSSGGGGSSTNGGAPNINHGNGVDDDMYRLGTATPVGLLREDAIPAAIEEIVSRGAALQAHAQELEQEVARVREELRAARERASEADRALCEAGAVLTPPDMAGNNANGNGNSNSNSNLSSSSNANASRSGSVPPGSQRLLLADPSVGSGSGLSADAGRVGSGLAQADSMAAAAAASSSSSSSTSSSSASSDSSGAGADPSSSQPSPVVVVAVSGLERFTLSPVRTVAFVKRTVTASSPNPPQPSLSQSQGTSNSNDNTSNINDATANNDTSNTGDSSSSSSNTNTSVNTSVSDANNSSTAAAAGDDTAVVHVYEAFTVDRSGPHAERFLLDPSCLPAWGFNDPSRAPETLLGTIVLIQPVTAGEDGVDPRDFGLPAGTRFNLVTAERVTLPGREHK